MLALQLPAMRSLLALLALAAPAAAQIGTPPPEFMALKWMNSPPLTLEELRGKAVLIQVFRTWNEQCTADVPALTARFAKDLKNGVYVIGVSSESPDTLAPWMRVHQPGYPILALKSEEFERALGARGDYFPISAVIDPQGSLTFSNGLVEGSAESKLAEAAAKATKGSLWPRKFDKALDALAGRALAKSWAELRKVQAGPLAEAERAAADKLALYLEASAKDELDECAKLLAGGRVFEAHERALPLAKAAPPFAVSPDAQALAARLEALEGYKDEMKVGPQFVELYELELQQELMRAVAAYRELQKKYPKLRLAAAIQARLDDLAKRGMLIYVRECDECVKAKKACARHAEKTAK